MLEKKVICIFQWPYYYLCLSYWIILDLLLLVNAWTNFLAWPEIHNFFIDLLCFALVYLSKFPKHNQGDIILPRYKSISSFPHTTYTANFTLSVKVLVKLGLGAQNMFISKCKMYLCWHDVALVDTGMWCLMYICVRYIASAVYVVFRNADSDMFVMYWNGTEIHVVKYS